MSVFRSYIGSDRAVCNAKASPHPFTKEEGFVIVYPKGHTGWMARDVFLAGCRAVTKEERDLLMQTNEESQISAITDSEGHF